MCFPKPKDPPPAPPPPPPAPPPAPPNVLQPAASGADEGKGAKLNKGRKSLRIDLTTGNVGGSSGLNLPVGQ